MNRHVLAAALAAAGCALAHQGAIAKCNQAMASANAFRKVLKLK